MGMLLDLFRNKWPYTDFHELNADWIISTVRQLIETMDSFIQNESISFADPITWNISSQYAKATVVIDNAGNAYLSKQAVPVGIQLNNNEYWQEIFNFTNYTRTANRNLTFNVETDTTRATAAYNVDDWLILNDVLYKVTQAIAIDDTFIIAPAAGSNIVHFTVEDFIKAFMTWATNTIQQYKTDIDASELAYKQEIDASEAAFTENLQQQFNAAIAGATVDSEVVLARLGADGITYTTLGEAIRGQVDEIASWFGVVDFANVKDIPASTEIKKIYLEPDTEYFFTTFGTLTGTIRLYEFMTDGTNRTIVTFSTDDIRTFSFKTQSNHDYVRLYVSSVSADATINYFITKPFNKNNFTKFMLTTGGLYITHTETRGITDIRTAPVNQTFKLHSNVLETDVANLPQYGKFAFVSKISSNLYSAGVDFRYYIYISADGDYFVGFEGSSMVWVRADNKLLDAMFSNAVFYKTTITQNGQEIGVFYPDDLNAEYVVYIMAKNIRVSLYEFKTGGSYDTLTKYEYPPYAYIYKPSSDVDYLRIYSRYATEFNNDAIVVITKRQNDILRANDSILNDNEYSNEFSAVIKFTAIGDSMMSGYYKESSSGPAHNRNIPYSWPQILGRTNGQIVQTAAQSGATCKSWYEDESGYTKSRVTVSTRSQVYLMGLGTNDYKDIPDEDITPEIIGNVNSIDTNNYENNTDDFWGNYAKILQYVHDVAPDAQIICFTIPSPRPETEWKETAIREICALPMFSNYVSLCDLVEDFRNLVDCLPITAHQWQNHFTAIGYAVSAKILHHALSVTMRKNKSKFINLPLIPYDPNVNNT